MKESSCLWAQAAIPTEYKYIIKSRTSETEPVVNILRYIKTLRDLWQEIRYAILGIARPMQNLYGSQEGQAKTLKNTMKLLHTDSNFSGGGQKCLRFTVKAFQLIESGSLSKGDLPYSTNYGP